MSLWLRVLCPNASSCSNQHQHCDKPAQCRGEDQLTGGFGIRGDEEDKNRTEDDVVLSSGRIRDRLQTPDDGTATVKVVRETGRRVPVWIRTPAGGRLEAFTGKVGH